MSSTDSCDVLVIGSGAAGLAAALSAASRGQRVILVEKNDLLGGTTAISAGWAWVPGNRQGVAQGDTREDVLTYLQALAPTAFNEQGVTAFLDAVPETIDFLEKRTMVEFVYPESAPDYQMELPGARISGRAIMPKSVDARVLGDRRLTIQPYLSSYTVFGYMPEVGPDIYQFVHVNQSLSSFAYVTRKLLRTWWDTLWYRRAVLRTNGNALITRMVRSALDFGVDIRTGTPALRLLEEGGRVVGAELGGRRPTAIRAARGVVIAAGGFSGDRERRAAHFPHAADDHFTPTIGHDGDALRLAEQAGGALDVAVESVGSWAPVTVFRYARGGQRLFPHLRAFGLPGLIAVDRDGRRFANESWSYHDFGAAMIRHNAEHDSAFGFIVADEKAMHKYGIGYAKPWPMPRGYFYRVDYLVKAPTLRELAERIGVDPDGLEATVAEFNAGAELGVDPSFGRGSTRFHHFKGDMDHKPNPNLAPLDKAPYYAVPIRMGDLGTFAGIDVGPRGEVLRAGSEEPVPGLYAVGAAARSVFGGGYPGYGANIGPALVFGYLAGRELARDPEERWVRPADVDGEETR